MPRAPAASSTASRCAGSSGPGSTTQPPATYVFVPSSVSGDGFGARTRTTPSGIRVSSCMAVEYLTRPATEQAAAIRAGQVSSRELVEESLHAIHDLNEQLNAFVTTAAERALAEADAIEPGDERPLAGVPIAVKDLIALTEGIRTTHGMGAMGGWVPDPDSATIRKLRAAGAIVVGKTNTPELGILPVTEPDRFGPARNPWDANRTPGGSSGGSGAAVASGMVSLAHGNDGGGSIRIPAACCGLVGLKPSRGRVSRGPGLGVASLSCEGVLPRPVAETAQVLDVRAGYEVGDATWAPRPVEPYAAAVRRDPGRLRIAMTAQNPLGVDVDPECVRGMHVAGELLASLGHEVEHAAPAQPGGDSLALFIQAFGPAVSLGIGYGELLAGRPPEEDEIEPLSRAIYEHSQQLTAVGYLAATAQLQALARGLVAFFAEYDLLL